MLPNIQKTTFRKIAETAKKSNVMGESWHFHLFSPKCKYNPVKGHYCFLLETPSKKREYLAVFRRKPMKHSERLARLQYGKTFFKVRGKIQKKAELEKLVSAAKKWEAEGLEWHPHHFWPDCKFNKRKRNHIVLIEETGAKKTLSIEFRHYPRLEIQKIEKIFYKKQAKN